MKKSVKKFSEVTIEDCKKYLRIEEDFTDDDNDLEIALLSAKTLILENCSDDLELLDEHAFYSVNLLYYIVSDIYHHRTVTVDKVKINPMFKMMMDKVRVYNVE